MAVSLRDLRHHIRSLDKLVTESWFSKGAPAQISFADLRKHSSAILEIVGADEVPRAASATGSPAAADNDKSTAAKRAAYGSAAADKNPVDLSAVLGLGHIRRN